MRCSLDEALARTAHPISVRFVPSTDAPGGSFVVAGKELFSVGVATRVYVKARKSLANQEEKS